MTADEEGREGAQFTDGALEPPCPRKQHDFQIAKVPSPTKVAGGRRGAGGGETSLSAQSAPKAPGDARAHSSRSGAQSPRTAVGGACTAEHETHARTRPPTPRPPATAAPPAPRPPRTLHRTPRPPGGGGPATGRPPTELLRPSSLHPGRRAFQQRQPFPEEVWFLLSVFSLFIKVLMQSYYHA